MEHTMLASYVCILVGHLVIDCKEHEQDIRRYLINGQFTEMVQILEKYYNFMNLTASVSYTQSRHFRHFSLLKMFFINSSLRIINIAVRSIACRPHQTDENDHRLFEERQTFHISIIGQRTFTIGGHFAVVGCVSR